MARELNRREFLKSSALGLLATAGASALPRFAAAAEDAGDIDVWVTNENARYKRLAPIRWQAAGAGASAEALVIDPEKKFQKILGFGAAFTDAACYNFNQLSSSARAQLFHDLFHPSEMGFNVCRSCVGSSDYSVRTYSYDEGESDPDLTRFSIDYDRQYILPMLRQARQVNPEIFLFSSPWSPPGWMKAGGSMLGGSMRKHYLPNYAQYFVKFLRAYQEAGVPIQAVTPQNEVDTDQDGRMPACIWPQEYEMEFVAQHLGPALEQSALGTKIWILDHNYNLWGRACAELDDPRVRKYCNAIAWHGYVGTPDQMTKAHELHPEAEMHWTEGGPDYTSPDYQTDCVKWGQVFNDVLRNWCSSITAWNFALDEHGKPNIGPFPCGGLVTIHSQTREITRSGQYWAFAHFCRHIQRGAVRIDSACPAAGISHAAFENPDGRRAVVIANSSAARPLTVQVGSRVAQLAVDSNSLTTVVWS